MAFSKLPLIPSTFKHGDMFPLPEGQQIEFKQSLFDKKKLVHTACAFLNTCGGYYIIGVWDDAKIVGVLRNKVDETLLRVDQIIQEHRIVNTTTGDFITHKEMMARSIPIEGSTSMIVVVEVQSFDPTHTYVVAKDQCHYVRLGASNMRYAGTLRDTAANYLSEIDSLKGKLRSAQDESRSVIRAMKELTIHSHAELGRILNEQRAALELLHKIILEQKVDAEKRMIRERRTGLLGLLCGVF
jgi:hypothetical protein